METKRSEAERMLANFFSTVPASLLMRGEWHDTYEFEEWDDEEEYLAPCFEPMWGFWFLVDDIWMEEFIKNNAEQVAQLGFTIITDTLEDYLFLGIDGAGYDFYEHHWIPLHKLAFED